MLLLLISDQIISVTVCYYCWYQTRLSVSLCVIIADIRPDYQCYCVLLLLISDQIISVTVCYYCWYQTRLSVLLCVIIADIRPDYQCHCVLLYQTRWEINTRSIDHVIMIGNDHATVIHQETWKLWRDSQFIYNMVKRPQMQWVVCTWLSWVLDSE